MFNVILIAFVTVTGDAADCGHRMHCGKQAFAYQPMVTYYSCYAPAVRCEELKCDPAPPAPTTPTPSLPTPKKESRLPSAGPQEDSTGTYKSATVVVDLPVGAALLINGRSFERSKFRTPILEPGEPYYYILTARTMRDGKINIETKQLIVRPGEEIQVSFQGTRALVRE